MNKAILMGRLTRDPEMRTTSSQVPVATFTLAVDRKFKTSNGERQADFINIVAWRNHAEFAGKYFSKGMKIVVVGSIQTRNYQDKDGKKVYITEIVAEEMNFAESKKTGDNKSHTYDEETLSIDEDDDTTLPFDL
jgi:single-strand DNA-binding protein